MRITDLNTKKQAYDLIVKLFFLREKGNNKETMNKLRQSVYNSFDGVLTCNTISNIGDRNRRKKKKTITKIHGWMAKSAV